MKTIIPRSIGAPIAGLLCSMLMIGCASSSLLHDPGRLVGLSKVEKNVARILAIWEPAEGTGVDGKPARGFAGQVMFFGPSSEAARMIEGTITIVEYDRYSPDDEDPEPLHVFTFEPDAWSVHGSDGALGYTYSVFIPYMQKHKDPVTCGLQVEYSGPDGRKLSSGIISVSLQGRRSGEVATADSPHRGFVRNQTRGPVQAASHSNELTPRTPAEERRKETLDTLTISLQNLR